MTTVTIVPCPTYSVSKQVLDNNIAQIFQNHKRRKIRESLFTFWQSCAGFISIWRYFWQKVSNFQCHKFEAFLWKSLHPKLVGISPGKIFLRYLLFCYETHFVPSIVVSIQKVQQFRMVESVHDLHFTFHIFPIFFTCVQNKFGRKGFSAFTMVASPHSSKFSSRETKQMSF